MSRVNNNIQNEDRYWRQNENNYASTKNQSNMKQQVVTSNNNQYNNSRVYNSKMSSNQGGRDAVGFSAFGSVQYVELL